MVKRHPLDLIHTVKAENAAVKGITKRDTL